MLMKKVTVLRFGSKKNPNVQTIGALLLFASLLMFLQSGNKMFESWDQIKNFPTCVERISGTDEVAQLKLMDCKQSLYNSTGIAISGGEARITQRQTWLAILLPVAQLFFWAIFFTFGLMLYKTGLIVVPIHQEEITIQEKIVNEKKK